MFFYVATVQITGDKVGWPKNASCKPLCHQYEPLQSICFIAKLHLHVAYSCKYYSIKKKLRGSSLGLEGNACTDDLGEPTSDNNLSSSNWMVQMNLIAKRFILLATHKLALLMFNNNNFFSCSIQL